MIDLLNGVNWQRLLLELGLGPIGAALPCGSLCPACRQPALTTYHDSRSGGNWHYCVVCRAGGDSIDIVTWADRSRDEGAAAAWLTTHRVLSGSPSRDEMAAYASYRHHVGLVDGLWQKATSFLHAPSVLKHIMGAYAAPAVSWQARGHGVIRMADPADLADAGMKIKPPDDGRVPILPLEDLPGRISALTALLIDENGVQSVRHEFQQRKSAGDSLPAVFGLAAMLRLPPASPILLTDDHYLAAKLQLRSFAASDEVMPLVAFPLTQRPEIIRDLGRLRKLVVWNQSTPEAFGAAAGLNASMLLVDVTKKEAGQKYLRMGNVLAWLKDVAAESQPWQAVLSDAMLKQPATAVTLLASTGISSDAVQAMLASIEEGQKAALTECLRTGGFFNVSKVVSLGGSAVCEDEKGWHLVKDGELLSDAILRIDRTIIVAGERPGGGKTWYQGRILYDGKSLAFTADGRTLERQAFRFVRQALLDAGLGLARFRESWQSKAFELSLLFHQPDKIDTIADEGWDMARQRFVLADCAIELGGDVTPLPIPVARAGQLAKPIRVSIEALSALSSLAADHPLWHVLLTMLHNLTAPIYGRPAKGLLITDDRVGHAVDLAKAVGCKILSARDVDKADAWTTYVRARPNASSEAFLPWLTRSGPCIAVVPDIVGNAAYINGGWFLCQTAKRTARPATAEMLSAASMIVPDFLQYLMSKRLPPGLWGAEYLDRVRGELIGYWHDRGGDIGELSSKRTMPVFRSSYSLTCFGRLLGGLYEADAIDIRNGSCQPKIFGEKGLRKAAILTSADKKTAQIFQTELNAALDDRGYPKLLLANITRELIVAGKLLDEPDARIGKSWLVPLDWLSRHIAGSARRLGLRLAQ